MEDWDQETLEKVVESKKTEYQQNKPTDIVRTTLSLFCCPSAILFCPMMHPLLCSFACHANIYIYQVLDLLELLLSILIIMSETFMS